MRSTKQREVKLIMNRLVIGCIAIVCALGLTAGAAEGSKKHKPASEQSEAVKQLLEKYDTNKDGKLDKQEKAAMTKADKKAWGQAHKKGAKGKENATK